MVEIQNHLAGRESVRHWQECDRRPDEWHRGLPVLSDGHIVLRELRRRDAASLLAHLDRPRVLRYIASSPSTIEGFQRFVRWTHEKRRRGVHICFGIVPPGQTASVGILQIWPIERDFSTAEWGFALSDSYWGTGLFVASARLFLDFVFGTLGVFRLEARAVGANSRGNRAFRKLGATRAGVLRGGLGDGDGFRDHVMWSMLASEWRARLSGARPVS